MRYAIATVLVAACGSPTDTRVDGPMGDDARGDDARRDDADTAPCATVLLYNDCDPALANCLSIPEAVRMTSDEAAARAGIGAQLYGGNHDQAAFRALFDAGGFDLIVFESSSYDIEAATADRLAGWITGGGRIVFSSWDLDGSSYPEAADTLRPALEVTTPSSFNTPISVEHDTASPVSFFDGAETFPSPLGFSNIGIDDGDELEPVGAGVIAARFAPPVGSGAIVVTRGGRAVVFGFLPVELVYQVVRDADTDGIPDAEELYANAISYLCGG